MRTNRTQLMGVDWLKLNEPVFLTDDDDKVFWLKILEIYAETIPGARGVMVSGINSPTTIMQIV